MATRVAYMPADLMSMPVSPGVHHYELSAGDLISVGNAGRLHEEIKLRILKALVAYLLRNEIGEAYSESMFVLGPETARIPDIAFVRNEKRLAAPISDGPIDFAPDLAVEIISESELASDAETKVAEYLNAGVSEVWQIYPKQRLVRIRTTGQQKDALAGQTIDTPILPGFSVAVDRFFPD
jgi:Uma2 family endonuclease